MRVVFFRPETRRRFAVPLLIALVLPCMFSALVGVPAALAAAPFATRVSVPVADGALNNPSDFATGDFNHDGNLDFIVLLSPPGDSHDATLKVFLGAGDASFSLAPGSPIDIGLPSAHAAPSKLVVGDFNGDGALDFAVETFDLQGSPQTSTTHVYLGHGDGSFSPAPTPSFVSGEFAPVGADMVAADVNGDGKLDLIAAHVASLGPNATYAVNVYLGHGDGTFSPAPGSPLISDILPQMMKVGDINGDGKLDLVVGLWGGSLDVFLGHGDGTFALTAGSPLVPDPANQELGGLTLADFNGDGKLDIATANETDVTVSVLLGNGAGAFTPAPGSPISVSVPFGGYNKVYAGPASIAAADLNGDGKMDLAVTTTVPSTVIPLDGAGDGTFTLDPGGPVATGSVPNGLTAGDFNNDGNTDLACVDFFGGDVSILVNSRLGVGFRLQGSHYIAPPTIYVGPGAAIQLVPGEGGAASGLTLSYRVYPVNSAPPAFTTSATFPVTLHITGPDGAYQLEYSATDGASAVSATQHQLLTLDTTPPAVSFTISAGQASAQPSSAVALATGLVTGPLAGLQQFLAALGGGQAITSQTNLSVSATDAGSGVASVGYRAFQVGAPPPGYTTVNGSRAAFHVVGPDGPYEVDVRATDRVGNVSAAHTVIVRLLNNPVAGSQGGAQGGTPPPGAVATTPGAAGNLANTGAGAAPASSGHAAQRTSAADSATPLGSVIEIALLVAVLSVLAIAGAAGYFWLRRRNAVAWPPSRR